MSTWIIFDRYDAAGADYWWDRIWKKTDRKKTGQTGFHFVAARAKALFAIGRRLIRNAA